MNCRRTLPCIALLFAIGCATPRVYGQFTAVAGLHLRSIARDAATKVAREYPPDQYAVVWRHETPDAFGRAVTALLQQSGYRVWPHSERDAKADGDLRIPAGYAVDQLAGTELVRVTLHLGARRLSRAYVQGDTGIGPAGPWSDSGELSP